MQKMQDSAEFSQAAIDRHSERMLIGCLLADQNLLLTCDLETEDFYDLHSREVYLAICKIAKSGAVPDEFAIMAEIEGLPNESEILSYMLTCWSGGIENVDLWLSRVHAARKVREALVQLDGSELTRLFADLSADDAIAEIRRRAKGMDRRRRTEHVTGRELMADAYDQFRERTIRHRRGDVIVTGVPTGVDVIDQHTGGYPIGTLSCVAARPGGGKTTWILNSTIKAARAGIPSLYVSNEDASGPLGTSALAHETRISRRSIRIGQASPDEQVEILRASETAADAWGDKWIALYVHGWPMAKIITAARAVIARYKIKLMALDYIQNVPSPERGQSRTYGIEENLTLLESLAAQEQVACPIGAQLKRENESGDLTMRSIKDSGAIEQKCKLIIALQETEIQRAQDLVDVVVLKQNEGIQSTIANVVFERSISTFG